MFYLSMLVQECDRQNHPYKFIEKVIKNFDFNVESEEERELLFNIQKSQIKKIRYDLDIIQAYEKKEENKDRVVF